MCSPPSPTRTACAHMRGPRLSGMGSAVGGGLRGGRLRVLSPQPHQDSTPTHPPCHTRHAHHPHHPHHPHLPLLPSPFRCVLAWPQCWAPLHLRPPCRTPLPCSPLPQCPQWVWGQPPCTIHRCCTRACMPWTMARPLLPWLICECRAQGNGCDLTPTTNHHHPHPRLRRRHRHHPRHRRPTSALSHQSSVSVGMRACGQRTVVSHVTCPSAPRMPPIPMCLHTERRGDLGGGSMVAQN